MNRHRWWQSVSAELQAGLNQFWIPVGTPGHIGHKKAHWQQLLDTRFGLDGWRMGHYVRGRILSVTAAIREYEEGYRTHLYRHPEIVKFLVKYCGYVYDDNVSNVYDDSYHQPHTYLNHYQDISVRRVISDLVDNPDWPAVTPTPVEDIDMSDLKTGETHRLPRARGFQGRYLLQIRNQTLRASSLVPR